jgi:hypothetical protein
MPKTKWDAENEEWDLDDLETALNEYEPDEDADGFYDGPQPKRGMYEFDITLEKGTSQAGNPKLIVRMVRTEDPYKGFRMRDWIPLMASTAWRVRPFLDAIGVTAADLLRNSQEDEDGIITKIGKVSTKGLRAKAYIKQQKDSPEYMQVSRWAPAGDSDGKTSSRRTEKAGAGKDGAPF